MPETLQAKTENAGKSKTGAESGRSGAGIQVIARAASILRVLESEKEGLSLGQIAKRVNLPRSTVQRIVYALAKENFLIGATPNARVKLGPAILRMAANTSFDFATHVRPHLEALAQSTGETVDLSMWRGEKMVFVDQIAGSRRLSAISAVGESYFAYSSASGKAALSLLDDVEIKKLFDGKLVRETPSTITSMGTLLQEINEIRTSHIAVDNEENAEGICAIGTAFHDSLGRIFAVSVPVPTIRFIKSKATIVKLLHDFRAGLMASIHE
ncbi:MAG: IclR family transcriptional regulator [Gammaproteobacteria bacterium]|nr:IclR family transcriptional regulator [Gammaproteobacteria bacterium]